LAICHLTPMFPRMGRFTSLRWWTPSRTFSDGMGAIRTDGSAGKPWPI